MWRSLQGTVPATLILIIAAGAGCYRDGELVQGENLLILEGATLIDGTGAPPREGSVVIIDSAHILHVGDLGDFRYPGGAEVIDLRGRWLVPGFMDLHFHVNSPEYEAEVLNTLLQFGVTTIRNPAAPAGYGTSLRDRVAAGEILGPRIFTAGPLIDLPGSLWSGSSHAVEVDTPEEIRTEVRSQAAMGVDYVKFYAHLPPELIRAGLEEAHAVGLKTIGHLGRTAWAEAAAMDIDAITHSGTGAPTWELVPPQDRLRFMNFFGPHQKPEFDPTLFGPWRQAVDLDGPEIRRLASTLAANRVELCPTLVIMEVRFWSDDSAFVETLEWQYAPRSLTRGWRGAPHPHVASWSSGILADARDVFRMNLSIIQRLHQAGVLLTTGTDFPLPWITPGVSLHREMWLLHQAGIPALDVLTIATRNGAEALGILDQVGTIQPGKRGDLVILTADPLKDIRNTRAIETVYLGGTRVARVVAR